MEIFRRLLKIRFIGTQPIIAIFYFVIGNKVAIGIIHHRCSTEPLDDTEKVDKENKEKGEDRDDKSRVIRTPSNVMVNTKVDMANCNKAFGCRQY